MNTAVRHARSTQEQDSDRQLKARHRALWALGDYPAVAAELIPELGPELVRVCGIRAGDRVLDVAAGSGSAAIPAAAAGAIVTASDRRRSFSTPGVGSPQSMASISSGWKPMRRQCRSRTTASTS